MVASLRAFARRLLGVKRIPTYYLPWLTLNGLRCTLILNNVEVRFKPDENHGPFPATVVQRDANGTVVATSEVSVRDTEDFVELAMAPTLSGYGFVTVSTEHLHSDLYVTVSNGENYTATHGRFEFIEIYPLRVRLMLAVLGWPLAPLHHTVPAFVRDQYAYVGPDSRSHLLLLNLSNVTNRIRVVVHRDGARRGTRLLTVCPWGAQLVNVDTLVNDAQELTPVALSLKGNAWFNLYLVGAGPRDLAGPLSLMHVK